MDFEQKRKEAFEQLSRCYRAEVLPRSLGGPSGQNQWAEIWRVVVEVKTTETILDIPLIVCIPYDFPLSLPRLYLTEADHDRFGYLPHVDTDRFICTFDPAEVHLNVEAPGDIAVKCVAKAARVLEAGINGTNQQDFEDEFLAYWQLTYGKDDRVEGRWLSLIEEPPIGKVYQLALSRFFGPYKNVLHAGGSNYDQFVNTLRSLGIEYREQEIFYLPCFPIEKPPFGLTNGDVVEIMKKCDLEDAFARYVNACTSDAPTVVFSKMISGQHIALGWRHPPPKTKRKGFRKGSLSPFKVLSSFEKSRSVFRINPDRFTPERFLYRTGTSMPARRPAIFIVGLGSIGSSLIPYLGNGFASKFGLLDPDLMKSENLGRHLLGISAIGKNKAVAVRDFILEREPFLPVEVITEMRLGKALQDNPELFSGYDHLVVAIGDTATELWLDSELAEGRLSIPTFFLWVEPYLAGGHCVYIRPGGTQLADLFDGGLYRWNIISSEEYRSRSFTKRESGCQTTFIPYAGSLVTRFIFSVFPHMRDAMIDDNTPSFRLTWTGDIESLETEIKLSDRAIARGPFHLDKGPIDA